VTPSRFIYPYPFLSIHLLLPGHRISITANQARTSRALMISPP
jgi:hypothetical protein